MIKKICLLSAFLAMGSFAFTSLAYAQFGSTNAGSSVFGLTSAKSCEIDTAAGCDWDTKGLFKCVTCYAKDSSSGDQYRGTYCVKKDDDKDEYDMETEAEKRALENCKKN